MKRLPPVCPACGGQAYWRDLVVDVVNGYLWGADSGDGSHFRRAIEAADAALREEDGEVVSRAVTIGDAGASSASADGSGNP